MCLDEPRVQYAFPTGCGHALCASCMCDVVYGGKTTHDVRVDPAMFGGPSFPDTLTPEFVDALNEWKIVHTEGYVEWVKSLVNTPPHAPSAKGRRVCPLCRSHKPRPIKSEAHMYHFIFKECLFD